MIAVVRPAAALIPEVMPKPIASGSATIATVKPATTSLVTELLLKLKSLRTKKKLTMFT
ncbi:unannotated protein [freshwater metagenome]|uniref:Unannotated protein n=1 Tax=freshwater metagenome TaxID=449393 RepID=A0A6J6ZGL6_9ZZZZ